ncbi:General transcriptional corepressor ssn6 [Frankliniella fusca]|uniref:General transcriptional corepressor ssn6 n=1 Tax=Frankliniella fusca TaxID=407009 RepID=A0AAE1LFQ2_9NEOP|nr:General transcriptional corepressor ssn6 [Frankliniella fusca]
MKSEEDTSRWLEGRDDEEPRLEEGWKRQASKKLCEIIKRERGKNQASKNQVNKREHGKKRTSNALRNRNDDYSCLSHRDETLKVPNSARDLFLQARLLGIATGDVRSIWNRSTMRRKPFIGVSVYWHLHSDIHDAQRAVIQLLGLL